MVNGGYLLTPYDPDFEKKMAKADDIINRDPNALARSRQVRDRSG
jgi:hypothetical protein